MSHAKGQCRGWTSDKWVDTECRACWYSKNPATYGGIGPAPQRTPTPRVFQRKVQVYAQPRTGCIELGPFLNKTRCGTIVHKCNLHGTCTVNKKKGRAPFCGECEDYEEEEQAGPRRHLLYFIFPVASNDLWRKNIDELHERLPLFNGRRVIAISTSEGLTSRGFKLDSPDKVMRYFGREEADFLVVPTVKRIRRSGRIKELKAGESAAFVDLMKRLEPFQREDDYTFYFHAKAVTKPDHPTAWRWAQLLYKINLDNWPRVHDSLRQHPITGAFKHIGHFGPGYNGAAFWFRNKDAFARNWQNVGMYYGAVELWPARTFPEPSEQGNLFGPEHALMLYHDDVMTEQEKLYESWRVAG